MQVAVYSKIERQGKYFVKLEILAGAETTDFTENPIHFGPYETLEERELAIERMIASLCSDTGPMVH